MRWLLSAVALGALVGCVARPGPGDGSDGGAADGGPRRIQAHAHNDYLHTRPLFDALDQHFTSVEADVWLLDGGLLLSHDGKAIAGELGALYLEPLHTLVQSKGSVYGDGAPFTLWIELQQGTQALQDALAARLEQEPMFTRFEDDGGVSTGAVTVVLTGNGTAKRAMVMRPGPRPFIRDDDFSPGDPPADNRWGYYAENYLYHAGWSGEGTIPEPERLALKAVIDGAHAKGRLIRIWGNPDTVAYWTVARDLGQDFIGADDLVGLAQFLGTR